MSLKWKHLRRGDLATFDGRYSVTNATIWEHSRVKEQRYEAHCDGTSLGFYPTGRAAVEACEQHNNQGGQQQ